MPVTKEHVFIPMADGVRLAATLYLPGGRRSVARGARGAPLPQGRHHRVATGPSTCVSPRPATCCAASTCAAPARARASRPTSTPLVERTDMVTVIDWLATRTGRTGNVGMYGTSYSGFNSIQIAMERPPALKAIIPIYATDDRFADDVHYFGGALKQLDQVDYPTYMVAMNALPPVPLDLRRRLARGVGAPGRRGPSRGWSRWLEHQRLRRLLAGRLAAPRLRRDRVPHDDHRGLGRRLPQQLVPHVRGADVPEAARSSGRGRTPRPTRRCPDRTTT